MTIERSVEWLLEHKHPVPYWRHLTPVEIDADEAAVHPSRSKKGVEEE